MHGTRQRSNKNVQAFASRSLVHHEMSRFKLKAPGLRNFHGERNNPQHDAPDDCYVP
jgi:hypothetical protein